MARKASARQAPSAARTLKGARSKVDKAIVQIESAAVQLRDGGHLEPQRRLRSIVKGLFAVREMLERRIATLESDAGTGRK